MKAVELLATVLTIAGFFLLSEKVVFLGFVVSIISNILWIVWGLGTNARGIIIVNAFLLLCGINGAFF